MLPPKDTTEALLLEILGIINAIRSTAKRNIEPHRFLDFPEPNFDSLRMS